MPSGAIGAYPADLSDLPPEALKDHWPLWLHERTHGLPVTEQVYKDLKAAFVAGWRAATSHLAALDAARNLHGGLEMSTDDPG